MTPTLADRVAARYKKALTWNEALSVLGLPAGSMPSDAEVQRAYRTKISPAMHPDLGGDNAELVRLNSAKDVLLGKLKPDHDPSEAGPSYGGGHGPIPEPEEIKTTFQKAESLAGIPSGVEWFFVTDTHNSGYSSDEFTNSNTGWVACGRVEGKRWVLVAAEHHYYRAYIPGGYFSMNEPQAPQDIWRIASFPLTTKSETPDAAELYSGVVKAWKYFEWIKKSFNSKVIPAKGWAFGEKTPQGRELTIKQLIANEFGGEFTGKMSVGIVYREAPYTEEDTPSGYYKTKWGRPYQMELIINGRDFVFDVADLAILSRLRVGGKEFIQRVFGDYPQHSSRPKDLTRNRDGKLIMNWMVEHLTHLPDWVKDGLSRAAGPSGKKAYTYAR